MAASLVPLPTLRGYRREWVAADVLAGLTLAAIAVPEQLATARLANMPALAGLYAFVAGSVLYALIGRSGQLSVGADSTIAPVLAAGVARLAVAGTPRYGELMAVLALMVGALVAAAGVVRFGWIAEFLSAPVITGVLGGIALEIVVRQLPAVLGVRGDGTTTIGRLQDTARHIGSVNGWAVGIAVGVLAVILVGERVDRRLPGALIATVGSVALAGALHLHAHGLSVLGSVRGGLPRLAVPSASWADLGHLAGPALTAAFLCLAQTAATVRGTSAGAPAAGEFNRDLVGVGAGSLAAGFAGSFAVNCSPPRTQVTRAAGGRTQASGLLAGGAALLVVTLATGLVRNLPSATLGAILVFVATRLFRIRELRAIRRYDRIEYGLAVITLLAVGFVGIEQGVLIAMGLSLADRTRRTARPRDVVLGREVGTPHWIPPDIGRPTEQVPGVLVYLMYAPLWYGNADYVRLRVAELVGSAAHPVRVFVLDADGVSDMDYTGARSLGQLTAELEQMGVTVAVARSSHLVHRGLKHSGLLAVIGPEHLYPSVEEAVEALAGRDGGAPTGRG